MKEKGNKKEKQIPKKEKRLRDTIGNECDPIVAMCLTFLHQNQIQHKEPKRKKEK